MSDDALFHVEWTSESIQTQKWEALSCAHSHIYKKGNLCLFMGIARVRQTRTQQTCGRVGEKYLTTICSK